MGATWESTSRGAGEAKIEAIGLLESGSLGGASPDRKASSRTSSRRSRHLCSVESLDAMRRNWKRNSSKVRSMETIGEPDPLYQCFPPQRQCTQDALIPHLYPVCGVRTRCLPAILHMTAPLRRGRKMAFGLGSSAGPHPRCTSLYTSGVPHPLWNGDIEWGVAATSFFLAAGAHLGSREVKVHGLETLMSTSFDESR